ncbi:MAG TPA: hypothetical protein VE685_18495 [Thermoanaerobaculia bacterium]|nr:hypothetical protein [Thermoanaerobaculia bacterium]
MIAADNGTNVRLVPFLGPDDFDVRRMEIEELLSKSSIESIEVRRAVVRALCKLAESLPVLDLRSTEEILGDEGEGFL